MRLITRLTIVLLTIVIFSGTLGTNAHAQTPPGKPSGPSPDAPAKMPPSTSSAPADPFEKATGLEKNGLYQDALKEYGAIVKANSGNNRELAAEALYRMGLFSGNFGKTPAEKNQNLDGALQAWKQLRDDYAGTKAAQKIADSVPNANDGPYSRLEQKINKRNAADWKYQVIDALVALTGRNPNFSYALALILLAVAVKLLLWPLTLKQYASMREMQRMQPMIKELQKKYKGAEFSQKQMELFKEHGVNPFASCFPALLQMPFLILIYTAIRLYEHAFVNGKFLWIGSPLANQYPGIVGHNLAQPDMILLVTYTITNYVTMRMTPATDPQQQQQQSTMAVMSSGIFFIMFIQWKFPSAFMLYWLALNAFSIWQQYEYVYKPHKERMANGELVSVSAVDMKPGKDGKDAGRTKLPDGKQPIAAKPPARVRPRKKK